MDHPSIYDDLANTDLGEKVMKLKEQNENLLNHIKNLDLDIVRLCKELTVMKSTEDNLKRNISELYNTSKVEIERKDRMISELRQQLDGMLFRRRSNNYKPIEGQESSPYFNKRTRIETESNVEKKMKLEPLDTADDALELFRQSLKRQRDNGTTSGRESSRSYSTSPKSNDKGKYREKQSRSRYHSGSRYRREEHLKRRSRSKERYRHRSDTKESHPNRHSSRNRNECSDKDANVTKNNRNSFENNRRMENNSSDNKTNLHTDRNVKKYSEQLKEDEKQLESRSRSKERYQNRSKSKERRSSHTKYRESHVSRNRNNEFGSTDVSEAKNNEYHEEDLREAGRKHHSFESDRRKELNSSDNKTSLYTQRKLKEYNDKFKKEDDSSDKFNSEAVIIVTVQNDIYNKDFLIKKECQGNSKNEALTVAKQSINYIEIEDSSEDLSNEIQKTSGLNSKMNENMQVKREIESPSLPKVCVANSDKTGKPNGDSDYSKRFTAVKLEVNDNTNSNMHKLTDTGRNLEVIKTEVETKRDAKHNLQDLQTENVSVVCDARETININAQRRRRCTLKIV